MIVEEYKDTNTHFKKSKLENGLTVVTEHCAHARSVNAAVYINKGTRDEPKHLGGAAHFIEHMVFKGSKKFSALDIVKNLEAVGGDINAYTTREYTCIHANALKENLNLSLDILMDMATNAIFDPSEFEKEKQVVLQEIEMSKDQLDEYVFDLYLEKAFSGQPLSRSILGTRASVAGYMREDVFSYYKNTYNPKNLIISVSGFVDHDEVVSQVLKCIKDESEEFNRNASNANIVKDTETCVARGDTIFTPFEERIKKPTEQVHLLYGFLTSAYKSEFRFEAYVANLCLGGGMTSRLYQNIREDKGLAYSVYSSLNVFVDTGLLLFYAASQAEFIDEVFRELKMEVEKFVKNGIDKEELEFFKNQAKGQILLGSEDLENRMNSIAVNEMVFGKYRSVDQVVDDIMSVSEESLRSFTKEHMNLSQTGNLFLGDI